MYNQQLHLIIFWKCLRNSLVLFKVSQIQGNNFIGELGARMGILLMWFYCEKNEIKNNITGLIEFIT